MPADLHYNKLDEIFTELSDLVESIPGATILHRLKDHQHLKRKREQLQVQNITELLMIVPSEEDCYRALDLIEFQSPVTKIMDYIESPWDNGYRAIHINYRHDSESEAQVEIMTPEMFKHALELEAEYGRRFWEQPGFQKH